MSIITVSHKDMSTRRNDMKKHIINCLKGKYGFWAWLLMWIPLWAIAFNLAYFVTKILTNK